jgi:hypothetical protein
MTADLSIDRDPAGPIIPGPTLQPPTLPSRPSQIPAKPSWPGRDHPPHHGPSHTGEPTF